MKQKVLFVGLGKRGEKCWLKLVLEREDLEIIGVVIPRLERENELRRDYPILNNAKWFRNLNDALGNIKPDICLVTSPPQGHYEQIKLLLENNIDVLAEKPLVMEFNHALSLCEIAKKQKKSLWIGQNFRYCQTSQYLYNLVSENKMGRPEMSTLLYLRNRDGKADWINKYPLTMEQPMLFEQSEHHFDLIRYCYKREVVKLYAKTMNPTWSMYANQATVNNMFEMEDGLLVNYFGTWSASHGYFDFQWRTDFEKGIVLQKSLFGDVYMGEPLSEELNRVDFVEEELFISDTRILLDKFVNRQNLSNLNGIPDIYDNLKTLALVFATLESDQTGKSVYLDEFMKKVGIADLLK